MSGRPSSSAAPDDSSGGSAWEAPDRPSASEQHGDSEASEGVAKQLAGLRQRLSALAGPVRTPTAPDPRFAAGVNSGGLQRSEGLPLAWQRHLGMGELSAASMPLNVQEDEEESQDEGSSAAGETENEQWRQLMELLNTPVYLPALPEQRQGGAQQQTTAESSMMQQAQGAEEDRLSAAAAAAHSQWIREQEMDQEPDEPLTGEPQLWGRSAAGGLPANAAEQDEEGSWVEHALKEKEESVPLSEQRLLQAGIVGVPNSGKSTLTNALVGQKARTLFAPVQSRPAQCLHACHRRMAGLL